MTGMLKSIGPVAQPLGAVQQQARPQQLQNPLAAPSRSEVQALMTKASNAGLRIATPEDADAMVRLFIAGRNDGGALADVAWALKMGAGSVSDAVAKVLASRQSADGQFQMR